MLTILAECSVFHEFFYWIWCVFDVPNWLTLTVEVGVAIALGIIFFKFSNRYLNEMKKGKEEKRKTAIHTMGFFVLLLHTDIKSLHASIEHSLAQQDEYLSPNVWDSFDKYMKPKIEQVNDLILLYVDNLETKEMEYIQGLVSGIQTIPRYGNTSAKNYIENLDEVFIEIARFTENKILQRTLGLIKETDSI